MQPKFDDEARLTESEQLSQTLSTQYTEVHVQSRAPEPLKWHLLAVFVFLAVLTPSWPPPADI